MSRFIGGEEIDVHSVRGRIERLQDIKCEKMDIETDLRDALQSKDISVGEAIDIGLVRPMIPIPRIRAKKQR